MANRWGTVETVTNFIFLGSKITADGDCSHEIKILVPWKKSYDKLRQHTKKQRHYFVNKGPSSQGYGFSSSHVWILSPCLFNLYAEYIMRNAGLDEVQAGMKIVGRNISNLRYADDTTLMAESEEEMKSFLMKVKEESKKIFFF